MGFGSLIRQKREEKGWTQRELAGQIGVTDGYIAHLEREVKLPSSDACRALARALELSEEEGDALLAMVEGERRSRSAQRLRTRGALRTRGSKPEPDAKDEAPPDQAMLSKDLAADPELEQAYRDLKALLKDPELRETVLKMLKAFARLRGAD